MAALLKNFMGDGIGPLSKAMAVKGGHLKYDGRKSFKLATKKVPKSLKVFSNWLKLQKENVKS